MKWRLDRPACSMLNRASRITAHAENRNTRIQSHPSWLQHGEVHQQRGCEPECDAVDERVEFLAEARRAVRRARNPPVQPVGHARDDDVQGRARVVAARRGDDREDAEEQACQRESVGQREHCAARPWPLFHHRPNSASTVEPANDALARPHLDRRPDRGEHVDARSEANQAEPCALRRLVALAAVRHDASRDEPGDLPHEQASSAALDPDGHLFVLEARLVARGGDELARIVVHVPDRSVLSGSG